MLQVARYFGGAVPYDDILKMSIERFGFVCDEIRQYSAEEKNETWKNETTEQQIARIKADPNIRKI